ncbi:putative B3 domain-containing protein At5g66980 isoform X2 [Corylus avellana]|uniref:putative B3 domain-containing protein At5g66980 isoform X2 n=1 Tax=Corylus avellana TaxID=13451 RepID=UPI00286A162B|nr:putative B3 domain-containing protein At5g66980 isoform X2 [Corylus avellana]
MKTGERAKNKQTAKTKMVNFSSSDDSPEFFKVFLPYTSSHQISIPQVFIKHFNGAIPKKATLFDHTKKRWHVSLEQTDGRLCFTNGWQSFASHHSLQFGDFLVFKYNRKSWFEVKIFSKTGCKKGEEAVAPPDKTFPFVDLKEEDSELEKTCRKLTCASKRKHSEIGLKKNEEPGSSSKAGLHKSRRTVETNQDEPNIPRVGRFVAPKNPYFVVAIAKHMRYGLRLQRSLVQAFNIRLRENVVIRDQNRKNRNPWPVKIIFMSDGRIAIGTGWSHFRKKNNIQVGDQCVFEFVIGRGNICNEMHVQILRGNARLKNLRWHWDLQKNA